MERTLAVLADFVLQARRYGAEEVLAGATMAARIAENAGEFQRRAEAQGTPISILTGEEEAELGFLAVAGDPVFARSRRISIIDPGGQSTELVTADRGNGEWKVRFRRSYPIGTLALRDGSLSAECPKPNDVLDAVRQIDTAIGMEYLPGACGAVAVLGASGTNLVTVKLKMPEWDAARVHGHVLDFEEVSRAFGWLSRMTDRERSQVVGLEPGREGTIHLGALILERFMHALHTADVVVSVRGWRHALLEQRLLV